MRYINLHFTLLYFTFTLHYLDRFAVGDVTQQLAVDSKETDAALVIAHYDVALAIQRHQLGAVVYLRIGRVQRVQQITDV